MNLSDPNVFPKNCSLDEENETKPELPQLLLLLYVPIILVTTNVISMYCKHFIFCSISICPSSWWPPSAIRPQAYIANISSLDPVKMWLKIKTQMENIVFSDGHEAILLTSYNLHHTKLHCCISHFLLWNLLRNTFDDYKDQNKQALFCPNKLTCFENKSAE